MNRISCTKTPEHLATYAVRCATADLQVGRQVARAMGVKNAEGLSFQQLHAAILDKNTELWDDPSHNEERFQQRLLERHTHFGQQTPYHRAFAPALRQAVASWPLEEVEWRLAELVRGELLLQDKVGLAYLADVLTDAEGENIRLQRALAWLRKQKPVAAVIPSLGEGDRLESLTLESPTGPYISEARLAQVDEIAASIGLICEGVYVLGPRRISAVIGFHQALKEDGWLNDTIPNLNAFFGQRYGVDVRGNSYTQSKVGVIYYKKTAKAMAVLQKQR